MLPKEMVKRYRAGLIDKEAIRAHARKFGLILPANFDIDEAGNLISKTSGDETLGEAMAKTGGSMEEGLRSWTQEARQEAASQEDRPDSRPRPRRRLPRGVRESVGSDLDNRAMAGNAVAAWIAGALVLIVLVVVLCGGGLFWYFHTAAPDANPIAVPQPAAPMARPGAPREISLPPDVPGLAALAADANDPEAQQAALKELGVRGPAAREAIPAVLKAMAKGDASLRQSALASLERMGRPEARAMPALIEALAIDDKQVRQRVAMLLGDFGGDALSAVPALLAAWTPDEPEVKVGTAIEVALERIGRPSREAIPALRRLLAVAPRDGGAMPVAGSSGVGLPGVGLPGLSPQELPRSAGAGGGRGASPPGAGPGAGPSGLAPPGGGLTLSGGAPTGGSPASQPGAGVSAGVQLLTVRTLSKMGPDAALADLEILRLLDSPVPGTLAAALIDLVEQLSLGEKALLGLKRALRHEDQEVRQRAARALGNLGPEAISATPDLIETMLVPLATIEGPQAPARLGGIGLAPPGAELSRPPVGSLPPGAGSSPPGSGLSPPRLGSSLPFGATPRSNAPATRKACQDALDKIGAIDPAAIDPLKNGLLSTDAEARILAAEMLARMGPAARPAIPRLVESLDRAILSEDDAKARNVVAASLTKIGPPEKADASALLAKYSELQQPQARAYVVAAVGGLPANETVPLLSQALRDDAAVRKAAMAALGKLGGAALTKFDGQTQPAIVPLLENLQTDELELRDMAIETLAKIGRPAVATLNSVLFNADWRIRYGAASALGLIGTDARPALKSLTALAARDGSLDVRKAAAQALQRINAK